MVLVGERPEQVDEADRQEERPRNLHKPQGERNSRSDEGHEDVVYRACADTNGREYGCSCSVQCRHMLLN